MDVKQPIRSKERPVGRTGSMGSRQRRALARLGLATAGAYVAPTLLALRAATGPSVLAADIVKAA